MIISTAIKYHETGNIYSLPWGNRHHDVIRHMCEKHGFENVSGESIQGFIVITRRGIVCFANRRAAAYIAMDNGQIKNEKMLHPYELFSEDLW